MRPRGHDEDVCDGDQHGREAADVRRLLKLGRGLFVDHGTAGPTLKPHRSRAWVLKLCTSLAATADAEPGVPRRGSPEQLLRCGKIHLPHFSLKGD